MKIININSYIFVSCMCFYKFELHLIGSASRTIDLAVSIKVIIELFGLVSKNCVPVWL